MAGYSDILFNPGNSVTPSYFRIMLDKFTADAGGAATQTSLTPENYDDGVFSGWYRARFTPELSQAQVFAVTARCESDTTFGQVMLQNPETRDINSRVYLTGAETPQNFSLGAKLETPAPQPKRKSGPKL